MRGRAAAYPVPRPSRKFSKTFLIKLTTNQNFPYQTDNKNPYLPLAKMGIDWNKLPTKVSNTLPKPVKIEKTTTNHDPMDFEDLINEQARPKSLLKTAPTIQPTQQVQNLADLDLEAELLKQYNTAQDLLNNSGDQPLNQKAQTLNAITSILQAIIKGQQDLYNIERLKTLENTLIKVLQGFPDIKHQFLDAYESELKKL